MIETSIVCSLAWGPDADRRAEPLIYNAIEGSILAPAAMPKHTRGEEPRRLAGCEAPQGSARPDERVAVIDRDEVGVDRRRVRICLGQAHTHGSQEMCILARALRDAASIAA